MTRFRALRLKSGLSQTEFRQHSNTMKDTIAPILRRRFPR